MRRFELPCRPSAGRSRGSPRDNRPQPGSVELLVAVGILVGLGVGAALALGAVSFRSGSRLGAARRMRQQILSDARREAEALRREAQIEAREQAVRLRAELEEELSERRAHVVKNEERLNARDEELEELERISGMTVGEAKAHLLERSEELVRHELARRGRQLEEGARSEAKRKARNLVADALQRVAASHAAETTVSIVELPSDDMKGRIIGREGRNIRALEHLTGVDFIIDDTPQAVVLSSFDGLRREIAKVTLTKLIEDGRIHPARIEETYYQSKAEVDELVRQAGEQAVFEAHCGDFHEELVKILGRLRYRTSYGQNVLKHTHEVEGSHAGISAQLAKRYGENQGVVHAIEAHHYEVQPQTVEAVLLIAADAISAARPGARGESLENYIKRLAALEELAGLKEGVERVYALQAGREIRVIVKPTEIDDDGAVLLSHEIAREIESELEYPGQVKVTVIRESRAVEFAK